MKFLYFLADYYILFAIISGVLLVALVGLVVGSKSKDKVKTASATAIPTNNEPVIPSDVKEEVTPVVNESNNNEVFSKAELVLEEKPAEVVQEENNVAPQEPIVDEVLDMTPNTENSSNSIFEDDSSKNN